MKATRPVFVVGSGRSGTRTIFKMLRGTANLEVHHEYACEATQRIAVLYSLGLIDATDVITHLEDNHASAIFWSESKYWVDSSNKLTWIIEPMIKRFPDARFVHLIRDGRKVTNSFFRKLGDEMYSDIGVNVLRTWLNNQDSTPMPPPEKRYWWNIPIAGMPMAEQFPSFSHYQRTVYHWIESTRIAEESLRLYVPESQRLSIRLEDLVADQTKLFELCQFLDIDMREEYWNRLQRPENVIVPVDIKLTRNQRTQFNNMAANQMELLGYDISKEEYKVEY